MFATRGFYRPEEQTLADCGGEIKHLMSSCELDMSVSQSVRGTSVGDPYSTYTPHSSCQGDGIAH